VPVKQAANNEFAGQTGLIVKNKENKNEKDKFYLI
jgi:hypothetical protein